MPPFLPSRLVSAGVRFPFDRGGPVVGELHLRLSEYLRPRGFAHVMMSPADIEFDHTLWCSQICSSFQ